MGKVKRNTLDPNLAFSDLHGKRVRLSNYRGENQLLVFNRGFVWTDN